MFNRKPPTSEILCPKPVYPANTINVQMLERIAKLEERVSALEMENRSLRQQSFLTLTPSAPPIQNESLPLSPQVVELDADTYMRNGY